MENFADRLREGLRVRGMNQKKLADIIDVTPTAVSGFINGKYTPGDRTIRDICNALNINESWLRDGLGEMERQTPEAVTAAIAKEYGLKPYAARLVGAVAQSVKVLTDEQLKTLVDRLIAEMQDEPESEPLMTAIRLYSDPAAAGSPIWAEDDYEAVEFPADQVPDGTDFAVRISGRSMEPSVKDGAVAFIHKTALPCDNDIVIAWVEGEGMVCKRAVIDNDQITALISDNAEYPNIEGDRLKNVHVFGVVNGIA